MVTNLLIKWQLKLNVSKKTKYRHGEKKSFYYTCIMMIYKLAKASQERHLGVILNSPLKNASPCSRVIKQTAVMSSLGKQKYQHAAI